MLDKAKIVEYLEELDNWLEKNGVKGELIIAGGAALSLVYDARDFTYDIDGLFEPADVIRKGIDVIAEKHGIKNDWLNDGVKGFMTGKMNKEILFDFENLKVYNIDAKGLLAMKLTSARLDSKDASDAVFLMKRLGIQNKNELYEIAERYANPNQLTAKANFFIQEVYEMYTKELKNESIKEIPAKPKSKGRR